MELEIISLTYEITPMGNNTLFNYHGFENHEDTYSFSIPYTASEGVILAQQGYHNQVIVTQVPTYYIVPQVPEPSASLMMIAACLIGLFSRRRK